MKTDAVDLIVEQWAKERDDLDASPLHILSRLFRVSAKLQKETAQELKEFNLEYWEFDVLAALRRQGKPYALPAAGLSSVCLLSLGAMTNRVDRLIERDLVERQTDTDDRRKVLVALTKKGKAVADEAVEARLKLAKLGLKHLTATEKKTLENLLRKLM